jgi:uncharacterized protein
LKPSTERPIETKGLFLSLAVLSLLLLMGVTSFIWWFAFLPRPHNLSDIVAVTILWGLRIFYVLIVMGIAMILATAWFERNFLVFGKVIRLTIQVLFPVTVILGRILGITRERIRESFVQVNNVFVKTRGDRYKPEEILVLLPHCLQHSGCDIRITNNIELCRQCGRCDIGGLLELSRRYKVTMAIATGGTLARKLIVERRPKFILAVACQRDLVSGIQDAFPIPSYGVLNLRPEGPCVNTRAPLDELEAALKAVLEEK